MIGCRHCEWGTPGLLVTEYLNGAQREAVESAAGRGIVSALRREHVDLARQADSAKDGEEMFQAYVDWVVGGESANMLESGFWKAY